MTSGTDSTWPYPPELDAMVAAADHHKVLFEDDRVRVLDAWCVAGDTVPLHTHCWAGVLYILSSSDFVRRDPDGNVLVDTRSTHSTPMADSATWGAALPPHSLENVGTTELRTITVEMKDTDIAHTTMEPSVARPN
jgi:hypothetical protein